MTGGFVLVVAHAASPTKKLWNCYSGPAVEGEESRFAPHIPSGHDRCQLGCGPRELFSGGWGEGQSEVFAEVSGFGMARPDIGQ